MLKLKISVIVVVIAVSSSLVSCNSSHNRNITIISETQDEYQMKIT